MRESILSHYLIETESLTYLADNLAASGDSAPLKHTAMMRCAPINSLRLRLGPYKSPHSVVLFCRVVNASRTGGYSHFSPTNLYATPQVSIMMGNRSTTPIIHTKATTGAMRTPQENPLTTMALHGAGPFPLMRKRFCCCMATMENKARAILQSASLRLTSGCLGQLLKLQMEIARIPPAVVGARPKLGV